MPPIAPAPRLATLLSDVNGARSECETAPTHSRCEPLWKSASKLNNADIAKVLRYSALIFGVFYGFQHQRSITNHAKAAHAQAEYKHKEDLIQKAKLEWAKKTLPPEAKTASGDSKLFGRRSTSAVD